MSSEEKSKNQLKIDTESGSKEKGNHSDESGFEVIIDPEKEKSKGDKVNHTGTKLVDSGGCPVLS